MVLTVFWWFVAFIVSGIAVFGFICPYLISSTNNELVLIGIGFIILYSFLIVTYTNKLYRFIKTKLNEKENQQ